MEYGPLQYRCNTVYYLMSADGNYEVTVTASNPLSRQSHKMNFLVQIAPDGVQLDSAKYVTVLGNMTRFRVSVTSGTELTYNWNMGDGKPEKKNGQGFLIPMLKNFNRLDVISVLFSRLVSCGKISEQIKVINEIKTLSPVRSVDRLIA